jgi:PTS system nitrogen regulatory IIA component
MEFLMSEPDFDVDALAAHLHLAPAQVLRLADRGKVPGRKVGGSWRFSRAEIHHWLEHRIGLSDDDELAKMEDVLSRTTSSGQTPDVSVAALLRPEAIALPLRAKTRSKVISSMVELAGSTGLVWDPEKMTEAVRRREEMQSTATGTGVALLHPRRPMPTILGEALLALGRTSQPIPFGGGRSGMTDVFFLVCSTDDRGHLRTLARLSRLIGDPALLDDIRAADDAGSLYERIVQREADIAG